MSMENRDIAQKRAEDLELAQAAWKGDDQAWRQIYEATHQPLFNFLCYQTGDRDVAKDLLQDTYVTALGRLDTFQGSGTLLGWLRAVALRKCLDWRRRVSQRLRKLTAFAREKSSDPVPSAQEAFPGLGDGFQQALDNLSPRQRAALLLRELEDLPFADVAEVLGCGEATARVHHHRACQNLRDHFQQGNDLVFGTGAEGSLS
jgi:RNA polymerase sigma-70 factor (ECF subfamily)|nr:RNA polymerase sigma factor [Candidatus Krumholzibacteria bacterium]